MDLIKDMLYLTLAVNLYYLNIETSEGLNKTL